MVHLVRTCGDGFDATIDRDDLVGKTRFQTMDAIIIKRRNGAIIFGRQSFQPRLTRMDDERITTCSEDRISHRIKGGFDILFVDTKAAFHGDRNFHLGLHRSHTFADQQRLAHEAGAKRAALHTI